MNLPIEWIRLADLVGVWLSTYLLHSTALLLPALLLSRWLGTRRLSLQESVLRVALIGGILTASLQVGLGWQAATGTIPYPGFSARSRAATVVAVEPASQAMPRAARDRPPAAVAEDIAPHARLQPLATTSALSTLRQVPWLGFAVIVWMLGAVLLTTRLGVIAWRLRDELRDRREITDGGVFRLFWRLLAAADVDRPTRLTRTTRLQVPVALGVGQREICLPARVAREMPREQQETVLAHELAHLERRDPMWLLVGRCLESVLFLQPLNRLARCKLQEVAEYRCDDWAAEQTGRPLTLARCLTEVASWGAASRFAALAPTMAGRPSGLGRRVRRLLDPGYSSFETRLPAWWRPLAAAALVLVLVAVPSFSIVGQDTDQESQQTSEEEAAEETATSSEESAAAADEDAVDLDAAAESSAPVIGPQGIVGPTEDFDASEPVLAPAAAPSVAVSSVAAPAAAASPAPVVAVSPAVAPGSLQVSAPVSSSAPRAAADPAPVAVPAPAAPTVSAAGQLAGEVVIASSETVSVVLAPRTVVRVVPKISSKVVLRLQDEEPHDSHGEVEAGEHDWEWNHELEDDLDVLEDELEEILEEVEESIEEELEVAIEALEDEMEQIEDEIEDTIELELETFEEDLELEIEAFEDELEVLEDRVDERLETVGWEAREEQFEADLERIEDRVDELMDRIDDRMDHVEERLERRLESTWERDFEHGLEMQVEAMEHRMEAETHRLERMVYELAEEAERSGGRLDSEERRRFLEEARQAAEAARPSAEELETIHAELERLRQSAKPSSEELEAMRIELREELEKLRAEAAAGLAEQREELQRLQRKHEIM